MAEYIVKETGYPGTLSHEVVGELIRCRDCEYWDELIARCKKSSRILYGVNDFCSKAKRKNHE